MSAEKKGLIEIFQSLEPIINLMEITFVDHAALCFVNEILNMADCTFYPSQ